MCSRNYSRSQATNFYLHDAWRARNCAQRSSKRDVKYPLCLGGPNQTTQVRFARHRSTSPNLPCIPYLQKGRQLHYPIENNRPRKRISQVASNKSIPNHALMKSLLSGLSVFEKDENKASVGSGARRPKSLGDIHANAGFHCDRPKSDAEVSVKPNCQIYPVGEFRMSCPECEEDRRKGRCFFQSAKSDKSTGMIAASRPQVDDNCIIRKLGRFRTVAKPPTDGSPEENLPPKRSCGANAANNLVAQRRQFFESKNSNGTKPEEIKEIYKNTNGFRSTSTLRSNGFAPVERSASRKSLIDSIRSKIFHSEWRDCRQQQPKFPKETRQAMSIILSNGAARKTRASPRKIFCCDCSNIPCAKNLLCGKGFHVGGCDEGVLLKLRELCTEDCKCRNADWPFESVRLRGKGDAKKREELSPGDFPSRSKCEREIAILEATDETGGGERWCARQSLSESKNLKRRVVDESRRKPSSA